MGLVEGDEQQEFDFGTINEIREVGKRDVNKLLKEGWRLLAVSTSKDGTFNYSIGRSA